MIPSLVHRPFRCSMYLGVSLVFFLGALACKPNAPVAPADTPGSNATGVPSFAFTETLVPSPTTSPPLVILLAMNGSDTEDVVTLQNALVELAAQDGLRFEMRSNLDTLNLDKEVRLLVAVPPDPGVLSLAAANPEIQFLTVGIPDLQAAQNLSVIGSGGDRPDQLGFLAGYLAAVITQDWRVGVITLSDTTAGRAARNGFVDGVIFYCGLCRPAYPPFYQYPVFSEVTTAASQLEQQAAADLSIGSATKTIYVYPGAGDESLLDYLAQAGMNIIGGMTPSEQVKDHWVASIRLDEISAVKLIWPRLIGGEGGINLDVPIVITNQNDSLFSTGRQRLVEKILAEMLAGYIDTGVDPTTGELH